MHYLDHLCDHNVRPNVILHLLLLAEPLVADSAPERFSLDSFAGRLVVDEHHQIVKHHFAPAVNDQAFHIFFFFVLD